MNHEYQVLHLGRTVSVWREIVSGLRVAAQFAASPREATELAQRARDIEAQLPRIESSAPSTSNQE